MQELTEHLARTLTLIRTFGYDNESQLTLVVVKMAFIMTVQGILWNSAGEMQLALVWPGTGNRVLGSPGLLWTLIGVLSLILASLCTSASLFLLSKLALSDTCTRQGDSGCPQL